MIHILNQDLLLGHLRDRYRIDTVTSVRSFTETADPGKVDVEVEFIDGEIDTITLHESFDSLAAVLFDSAPALTHNVVPFPGVSAAGRYAADHPNGDDAA